MRHLILFISLLFLACNATPTPEDAAPPLSDGDRELIETAEDYLDEPVRTVVDYPSPRSAGGPNDFHSEGDYWWPDPENPDGPYVRKDGQTNPDNFVAHRRAMVRLRKIVGTLVMAYRLTEDARFAEAAREHLSAWFLDPQRRMNPSLLYAQAISGRVTGRGIGIIDTIHLIEVATAIMALYEDGGMPQVEYESLKGWFGEYLDWMMNHEYGIDERDHGNNHSTWWAAQAAAFARLAEAPEGTEMAREVYKKLLDAQMDERGGFPDELERTKPYNYSLFNLEGYAILAHFASGAEENLWTYATKDGTQHRGWQFMLPHLVDKSSWPYEPDVQHFDELPIQTVGMRLAAEAYADAELLTAWEQLSPERESPEIERNFPAWRYGLYE